MATTIEALEVSTGRFTLPAEELLTGRGFVTGKSGSGKSNTASVIIEELLDRNIALMIVDTDGEYHGLTEEYDLLHAGNGSDYDRKITIENADQLTAYALEDQHPILFDISSYADEKETERVLYKALNAMFVAEQDYQLPFLVLIEEAHEFLPQSGGGDSDLKPLLIRIAKRGRKRGLGICCLSQRPAAVDKEFITQCNWFVWHRLTWENDTDVVARILGRDSAEIVQSLDNGEAIVQTDWDETTQQIQFRRKRTEDAGSTPTLDKLDLGGPDDEEPAEDESAEGTDEPETDGETEDTATHDESSSPESPPDPTSPTAASTSTTTPTENQSSTQTRSPPSGSTGASDTTSSADSTSASPLAGQKPSLSRRRAKRQTPSTGVDPLWEVGAMIVYAYDSIVWYHLAALYRLEVGYTRVLNALRGGRPHQERLPSRPPLERYGLRALAALTLIGCYAVLVGGLLSSV